MNNSPKILNINTLKTDLTAKHYLMFAKERFYFSDTSTYGVFVFHRIDLKENQTTDGDIARCFEKEELVSLIIAGFLYIDHPTKVGIVG